MLISEIFYSVQGEGLLTGVPSVFIRTSGCNLRCRWCDTPYASWQPEGEDLSIDTILARAAAFPAARHAVLTGGEPMIARDIQPLASALRTAGFHITIETAGTVPPGGIPCDLASLSPKLAHSTPLPGEADPAWRDRHETRRLQPGVLRSWLAGCPDFQIKFVISSESDLPEIDTILTSAGPGIPPHRVLLMPEGRTADELATRSAWLVDVCKTRGFRYCRRLHIDLFGNRRGT